jgi:UDP-2,3-diacylglucosamine pyrophosphatase LpxH
MNATPPRTELRRRGVPDRLVAVFSDIEMGAGGPYDDFLRSDFLAEIIRSYGQDPYRWLAVDLVFNGDTFDLLKTSTAGAFPTHITRDIAVAKMERIAAAHPAFFEALRDHVRDDPERRRVFFVVGNHDMELFFPEVQAVLRGRIGAPARVFFPGLEMSIGRLHVEHGSQLDPLFRVDGARPFITPKTGEPILALSWATVALLEVVIPLQPLLYHHDRLKPKELVFELMPEVKELLTSGLWTYWTRRYFQELVSGDPIKTVSWTMIKELVWRLASWNPEIELGEGPQRRMMEGEQFEVYLVGHQHEPGWWSHGNRKVLRTGCIRDEFMIVDRGCAQVPINKTWAEIYLRGDDIVRSQLIERVAPERPAGTTPDSIFDVLPAVRERLAAQRDVSEAQRLAQEEQEARERSR